MFKFFVGEIFRKTIKKLSSVSLSRPTMLLIGLSSYSEHEFNVSTEVFVTRDIDKKGVSLLCQWCSRSLLVKAFFHISNCSK